MQARITALESSAGNIIGQLDESDACVSRLKVDLAGERNRVAELEAELREAETLRRKLHNTIQELKGMVSTLVKSGILLVVMTDREHPGILSSATSTFLGNDCNWMRTRFHCVPRWERAQADNLELIY